ncbi:hypothetical protein PV11_07992 [Exophiala sideris]|uniref:DUF6604 domain-containing protein n=2 Tax=Exophiala sideris TaxID=1016849 RepID=A0A0D1YHQ0_9EURO|nr:hypothetical protein PV11_07992 [Exophiala sideris]
MLLNPSHKITYSGLPPDILDAYVRYKKGSRALVAWLSEYSPSPIRRAKSLPIKELRYLAGIASQNVRSLPDTVHFYFRETISARNRLSKYFRAETDGAPIDTDTINHEHFTTSLAEIYSDLCACCKRNDHAAKDRKKRRAQLANGAANRYVGLTAEHIEDNDDEEVIAEDTALASCPECTDATPPTCNEAELHFADDELGTFLEVTAAIQRMRDISSSANHCWHLAAKGQLSFTVAAFTTSVAFSMVRQVGVELLEHDEQLDLSRLHQVICSRPGSENDGANTDHILLSDLQTMQQSLLHYREGHGKLIIPSCAGCLQKPAEYIQPAANDNGAARPQFVEAVVDNIVHLVSSPTAPPNIVRTSTPVYADLGYFVTRNDEKGQSWASVQGLHLLTSGYKAYLQSLECANSVSLCRLAALRLAQTAVSQVARLINDKTCFPCRCTQTLAYHLANLEADLQSYTRHKCWDMYFQAPWVCGSHILEMLDLCHYYGMRLLNYRHYVGAVLHSYNVLRRLGGLEESIPILDALSEQFSAVFFPGGTQPKNSFRACWSRYVGARLKFNKKGGHNRNQNRNSRDSWCMAIPAHAARRAAGLGVGEKTDADSATSCMLFQVKQRDYHVAEDLWEDICHDSASGGIGTNNTSTPRLAKGRSNSTAAKTAKAAVPAPGPGERLLKLAEAAQGMFDAGVNTDGKIAGCALPVARLNLFAVFERCVRVVSRLSDETHTGKDERGINCICFASAILTGADRIVDGRKLGRLEAWKKDERECIEQAKSAIWDVFGDVKREEWLWDV